ncbi:hypothetical protein OSSY52_04120 [Tepiditoga spiralis]|uniref:Fibronectin type-III domain-containing protein n=1 Tax=Tepiditoga spiralis TaxID=2108365 RepID=A0A7G1G1W8_9BACT|nr:hypothetical protein [Tepiditoga spiralis]BBE30271.1 hypothetical protein OSSY52_04120 [Tepiditoga spiralis]
MNTKTYKYKDLGFRVVKRGNTIPKILSINPENYKSIDKGLVGLKWEAISVNGGNLTYDVYFGTEKDNLLKVSEAQTENSYNLGEINEKGIYYWKVAAKSDKGRVFESPIYRFYVEV